MTKTFCAFFFTASESVPSRTWRKGSNRLVANNITISSREQNAKSFPCGNCNSVFSMKHNLQYHWRIECGQPPRYNCPYCAYRTKHPSNRLDRSRCNDFTRIPINVSTILMEHNETGITPATSAAMRLRVRTICIITSSSSVANCRDLTVHTVLTARNTRQT
ncbi:PREDICTED: longitudinals lacking protein, isoforms A/B/D/L-like [Cyphomyrmex costatus]|uniref:longitudinals lacking protein, isoforms A/B/D/L-like n=1 Tax=Cyphomyrmex costatus TaxID=456900 RepID=UPI0008523586|nr:PREDICTED: longitudinals lacking protein, isoforms A/B/D/L-like [Cyphomyrmex costatus]